MPSKLHSNSLLPLSLPCLGQINDTHRTGPCYDRGLCSIVGASLWCLFLWVKAVRREYSKCCKPSESKWCQIKLTFIHDKLFGESQCERQARQSELWCHREDLSLLRSSRECDWGLGRMDLNKDDRLNMESKFCFSSTVKILEQPTLKKKIYIYL